MRLSDITREDALMAANLAQILAVSDKLLDALKLAGLPVTGPGLDRRAEAQRWFLAICTDMAKQIQTPAEPMRVKAMGDLQAAPRKTRKNKA